MAGMELLLSLLIIAGTAAAAYAIIRSKPPAPQREWNAAPYQPQPPAAPPALHWEDGGRFMVEVVIESKYQPVLKELAGTHGDAPAEARYSATLMPDDANPYEDKAVTVFVDGRYVGQLAAKEAVVFRQRLALKEAEGQPSSCAAIVRGGGLFEGRRLSYVVALDLEPLA